MAAICDEIAFWRSEDSANRDTEVLTALRPAMATVPNSLLLCISSPFARRGALWQAYEDSFGKDDPQVLVWQAETRAMNPSMDEAEVRRAYERDPVAAEAEWGAQFRSDAEVFLTREMLRAVVVPDRLVVPPLPGVRYVAFVDPSGGTQDAMTLAIAHKERDLVILDLLAERRPSFSPEAVVAEFTSILRSYRVGSVTGDRHGGDWSRDRFRAHGMYYAPSDRSKSEIYGAFLPLLTSGRVELLDHPKLLSELLALDRRVVRGGRESIDHPRGGRDDLANAAAGAIVAAMRPRLVLLGLDGSATPPQELECPNCRGPHARMQCPLRGPTIQELSRPGSLARGGGYASGRELSLQGRT